MKKYIVTCLVGLCTGLTTARSPFKCTLYDRENKIYLHLDLYEETGNGNVRSHERIYERKRVRYMDDYFFQD